MGKGIICCDTTVIINFKNCKLKTVIFNFIAKHLKNCQLTIIGYEINDKTLQKDIVELTKSIKVELLPSSEVLKAIPADVVVEISMKYNDLDDGEKTLIAYALSERRNGKRVCLLSDDQAARKAGRNLQLLPCCIHGKFIGGTLGIINALLEDKKGLATKVAKKIQARGNYIPLKEAGKTVNKCDNPHC